MLQKVGAKANIHTQKERTEVEVSGQPIYVKLVKKECALKCYSRVTRSHEVKQLVTVFTYEWLDVVTGYIVPFQTVIVEVVEDRQARLVVTL